MPQESRASTFTGCGTRSLCQWLERGGNLAALQQILGHASIETTQRYARLTDEVVVREAARICP